MFKKINSILGRDLSKFILVESPFKDIYSDLNLKNVNLIFYIGLLLISFSKFILVWRLGFNNVAIHFSNLAVEIVFYFVFLYFGYFFVKLLIPFIQKIKNESSKGNVWYYKMINLESYSPLDLFFIKCINFIANLFKFVFLMFGLGSFFAVIFSIFGILFQLVLIIFKSTLSNGDITALLIIFSFSIWAFLICMEISVHSLTGKYHIYKYLYINLDKIPEKRNQLLFFENILLASIKDYSFYKITKKTEYFSNRILKQIVAYYENILIPIFGIEKVKKDYLPELDTIIEDNNYDNLLKYIKKLEKIAKKNKIYLEQFSLIQTYKKDIDDNNPILFSNSLLKLRLRSFNLNNFFTKLFYFISENWLGRILFLICIIILGLYLMKIGKLNWLMDATGTNETQIRELIMK